ncbi:MAG: RNA 2',3'-cyclic phosphodiesterase [Nitrospirae bacterium]|nr:RNA 2',3'-cyclic phosphodiesterase [Nitrospirota bacterium]
MRCFIAIELPEAVKSTLSGIEEDLKKSKADVRWVKPDNIHLTLKFFGNIEEKKTEKIIEIMENICNQYAPFTIEIKGMGTFPNIKSPRVLWVGIEGNDTLKTLQEEIENKMESIGFEREDRAFTAHLTLGRFRSSIEKEGLLKAVKLHEKDTFVGSINVQSLSLIRSDLHPEGARYTKVIDISLGKTIANT